MLKPINAQTQAPLGIFDVDSTWETAGIEGGYVGALVADGYGIKVVNASNTYSDASSSYVLGLVDDSTTGSNYSTLFGSLQPAAAAATVIGPSTIKGSGKATLWTQAGLYLTDQLTGFTANSSENSLIYSTSATGKLTLTSSSNGDPVGRALAITDANSDLLESLVSPIAGVTNYLIYFFGGAVKFA